MHVYKCLIIGLKIISTALLKKFWDFILMRKNIFVSYHASNMHTKKWYMLKHPVDAIKNVGGIEFFRGGLYAAAQKTFIRLYGKLSKNNFLLWIKQLRGTMEIY